MAIFANWRSRWLDWQPSEQMIDKCPRSEPPKPPKPSFEGFEGTVPGHISIVQPQDEPARSLSGPVHWGREFHFWVLERWRFLDRYWTPLTDLQADFCSWNVYRDCDQATFEALLRQAGFRIEAQSGVVWVYGLVLAAYLTPEEEERT